MGLFSRKKPVEVKGKPVHVNAPKSEKRLRKRLKRLNQYLRQNPDAPKSYHLEREQLRIMLRRNEEG